MVEIKRLMETDDRDIERQIFPITHVSAILGLEEIASGDSPVLSVNGYTGAVVITKEMLGLGDVITQLPYATEDTDGIITAEIFNKIQNMGDGDYVLPVATSDKLGGIKIGALLSIDENGKVSAIKQTDQNFTDVLKTKLESLMKYKAGENVTISEDGEISATVETPPPDPYVLPTASDTTKGGVKIGTGLSMTNDTVSAEPQFNYTAGANISISNTGVISATGGGEGGGVSQAYVDEKASEAYQNAKAYADSKIPSMTFEKVGEV